MYESVGYVTTYPWYSIQPITHSEMTADCNIEFVIRTNNN